MYTEADIVVNLKKGDETAINFIIENYSDSLLRSAYGITGDLQVAEEVVQDTFLKVCRNINTFHGDSLLRTWVFRIMVNTAKNRMRGGWIRRVTPWGDCGENLLQASAGDSPEEMTIQRENRNEVVACLKLLSQKYREVLVLYYIEDLKVQEICDILNESQGTVKSKLSRGREKLRALLDERVGGSNEK